MRMIVKLFFITIIILSFIEVSGQGEIVIKGKVTDHSGIPLVGTNVSIAKEPYGSSADKNGDYIFKLPDSYIDQEIV